MFFDDGFENTTNNSVFNVYHASGQFVAANERLFLTEDFYFDF